MVHAFHTSPKEPNVVIEAMERKMLGSRKNNGLEYQSLIDNKT